MHDTISISYASIGSADPQDPRAVVLSCFWDVPETESIAEQTILDALAQKYGPMLDTSGNRAWDRQGRNLTSYAAQREHCAAGAMQIFDHRHPEPHQDTTRKVNPYCGPEAEILVITDGLRVRTLSIALIDPDEVWDDFWRIWSVGEYGKIKADFATVSNASGAAPEL